MAGIGAGGWYRWLTEVAGTVGWYRWLAQMAAIVQAGSERKKMQRSGGVKAASKGPYTRK